MNEREESQKQAEIRVRVTIPDNCRGAPPGTYPLAEGVELVITDTGYPLDAEARRQFLEDLCQLARTESEDDDGNVDSE